MTFLDYLLVEDIARRHDPVLRREEYRRTKRTVAFMLRYPLLSCLFLGFLAAAFKYSKSPVIMYSFLACSALCVAVMALQDNGIRRRIDYVLLPLGFVCLAAAFLLFFNKHKALALLLFIAFIILFYVIPLKIEAWAQKVSAPTPSSPAASSPAPEAGAAPESAAHTRTGSPGA